MARNRDDFTAATKEQMAKRVGYRCSNPDCRKATVGPSSEEGKTINIGVAAHIRAAAFGGKRFDIRMTHEERKGLDNGIWLCQSCSKLIDSDARKYTVDLLRQWKAAAEERAEMELRCQWTEERAQMKLDCQRLAHRASDDIQQLKFYLQCMDRPAFHDALRQEQRWHDQNLEKFQKAIGDTIIAFNTGVLRDREGHILMQSEGRMMLENEIWRERVGRMVRILTDIRNVIEMRWYQDMQTIGDPAFVDRLERDRQAVIEIMNSLCRDAGLNELDQW